MQLKNGVLPKLSWNWGKGVTAASLGDFGSPITSGTSYRLCVYDESGGSPIFKMGVTIPTGGMCGSTACWKTLGASGWSYKDKARTSGGIKGIAMKGGAFGKPLIKLTGGGLNLPLPTPVSGIRFFEQDTAVIVQLFRNDAENCWSSTFDIPARRNDGGQFVATKP